MYYPWLIASEGHTSAQVPHSVHMSGLIEYLSPSEIAPTGHSSIQDVYKRQDWAEPDEKEDVKELWDSEIEKLKRVSGL